MAHLTSKYKALVIFDRPVRMDLRSEELKAHGKALMEKFLSEKSDFEDQALFLFGEGFDPITFEPAKPEDPETSKVSDDVDCSNESPQSGNKNDKIPKNCLFNRSKEEKWLLIGLFASTRKVIFFTDSKEQL